MADEGPSTLIEVSWEVLNKVGGIHTVVKSKAELVSQRYADYLLVGPLFPGRQDVEFQEQPAPERVRQAFETLGLQGIQCMYGTWLIRGRPNVVLVDASNARFDLNALKGELWEKHGIDSLNSAYEYDEPLRWSWAVGMLIEELARQSGEVPVAQFHEWMSGFGLLYLKGRSARVGTVFTTHATMLGRTISGATDIQLYDELESIDADATARRLGVMDKHSTERACAKAADVFTTVSEITGQEAEHLLGRKPDVLLFNGLQLGRYPTSEEASLLHRRAREQIRDFLDYYFFSHYTFDLDETLTFFVSGRYEYRNKGLDVLTAALGKLNEHLKRLDHPKHVVVFYFIPGDAHGKKTELLEERAAFSHMQQYLQDNMQRIVRTILRHATDLEQLNCTELLDEATRRQIERMAQTLRHDGLPPIVTHNLPNEHDDAILADFRAHGLVNREEDRVKVIRYPIYLTGSDGLLDLSYTETVAGSHLGIFPSYYEPWGYTPVECAALGVPAVTTDLAGFGLFIREHSGNGVYVLPRHGRRHEEIVSDLFEYLAHFCDLDKFGRSDQKLAARSVVTHCDWEIFIKHYFQAHAQAHDKHK